MLRFRQTKANPPRLPSSLLAVDETMSQTVLFHPPPTSAFVVRQQQDGSRLATLQALAFIMLRGACPQDNR